MQQTALALMKKASLEPLEEKESASTTTPREPPRDPDRRFPRKQMLRLGFHISLHSCVKCYCWRFLDGFNFMVYQLYKIHIVLSSHSSCGDGTTGPDLTPPGDALPSYLADFLGPTAGHTSPKSPMAALPKSVVSAETRIREVVSALVPGARKTTPPHLVPISVGPEKERTMRCVKQLSSKQKRGREDSVKELSLEERLLKMGSSNDSLGSPPNSGKRSTSPLDWLRTRGKVTPTPPPLAGSPDSTLDDVTFKVNNMQGRGERRSPTMSPHLTNPSTPITSKLSQLEEWIL